ncbi:ATP phosphoribosyltransferase regulatory subunit [Kordiimonas sp. SCSIO 12603]|uniref:ATP phosphoribosyltransferase regulatory subunit n=1 Tax=Kordiimonas sp. SCSIO 12603 TaxID=2829596 RepID=UPI0021083708|nr:ATP phosphoribosyltransferase regulatory subunit [Kordiimonas sp. SCSIO 12603]UTW57971.1 ATP phosphoribosyltransferase regulatory subunit [Kordiimonas sp. SCSIO 12603]
MNGPSKKVAGSAYARQALLPEGFRDQLAPKAEQEATLVRKLVDTFLSHGHDRVSPPVVEYEDSLLVGAGATKGKQMFRLMDPDTQRMMAVRADMTIQMARLAATRLADSPRPLRLAYAGSVLRTKGSQIRPDRQFIQAGVELVGSDAIDAELEVIAISVEALEAVGIADLTLDLTIAPLAAMLCDGFGLELNVKDHVLEALDAKDIGALAELAPEPRAIFEKLLSAAGPAEDAVEVLSALELNGEAGKLVKRLASLVEMLGERLPDMQITADPCETHGFEYKTGIGFALFAKGGSSELGRGGRYQVIHPDGHAEDATGFSVYLDSLMGAVEPLQPVSRVYLPKGTDASEGKKLREEGFRTIQGLTDGSDFEKEAARLGCSHVYAKGAISAI